MAVKWISQVWESNRPWSGSKLLVMLALADYANDDGYFWPSIPTVAKKCRLSERQAQRIIHELIDEDAIEIAKASEGRGHSNFYRIKDVINVTLPPAKGDTNDRDNGRKGVTNVTLRKIKRVTSSAKRVTSSALKGDIAMSSDPLEPSLAATAAESIGAQPAPPTPPAAAAISPEPPPTKVTAYVQEYEKVWGLPIASEYQIELVAMWAERVPLEAWSYGLKECAKTRHVGNWKYLESILARVEREGLSPPAIATADAAPLGFSIKSLLASGGVL